ncbi:Type II inositol 1-4-5-trisphosphate 5 [Brachionus plicatilis]|uniref:Type II inositol 1-4-5-trisphosphate 5 n=1 Tax=Brachionus plicatilis TaxID=10195 RepID=A0A3M7P5V0_BRAPC|nr:Type II inositol 1-4-5-trisphosphate 5 [Brachionus plicatilis]
MEKTLIKQELSLYEEEYIKYKNLRIFCGTYNVNGRMPDESLSPWIKLNSKEIDIYAIGFQELVDLNTTNLLIKNDINEQLWTAYIETELSDTRSKKLKYHLLTKSRMFGLFLLIYVSEKLIEKKAISEIMKSQVATGIMDMLGNKGSLGISFKLFESRICFVCSHFAADTDKLEKRNSDFRAAMQKLNFQQDSDTGYSFRLDDHDTIFWFGDLNYRLDNLSLTRTFRLINEQNYDQLLKYDQLSHEKTLEKIFHNYQEGRINFRPTYKYVTRSDLYEKQSLVTSLDQEDNFGKVKLPSWTDRVLYKSQKCTLVQYSCINTITVSDHKPVYALFDLEVKKIDQKKYMKLYEDMLKESDKRINELMPHIELQKFEYDFGKCYFYDVKALEMVVHNKGATRSNVDILFYENKPDAKTKFAAPWVTFMPQHKERLEPGKDYKIEIRTCFSPKLLPKLIGQKKLEDFLIVRCLNGNDSFATVTCDYQPTLIGVSLKALTTIKDTFENVELEQFEKLEEKIKLYEEISDKIFKQNFESFLSNYQANSEYSLVTIRLDFFDAALTMTKETIEQDEYFDKNLSDEYVFLLNYLIKRCTMERGLSRPETKQTIEEQKNSALISLSRRNFAEFENFNFDMELLAELLYDLLYSLPCSLIPRRYINYCSFLASNKISLKDISLFDYIPKSHKHFLNESNYSSMIAAAIFQIDKETDHKTYPNYNPFNFIKIFIDNENFV